MIGKAGELPNQGQAESAPLDGTQQLTTHCPSKPTKAHTMAETLTKRPAHRPKLPYNPTQGEIIADLHAGGLGLKAIGRRIKAVPSYETIQRWVRDHEEFSALLARARSTGYADGHAEDALLVTRKAVAFALKGDKTRAKAVVAAYDKLAAQHRWHAACADPRWNDKAQAQVEGAKALAAVMMFSQLSRPPTPADAVVVTKALGDGETDA